MCYCNSGSFAVKIFAGGPNHPKKLLEIFRVRIFEIYLLDIIRVKSISDVWTVRLKYNEQEHVYFENFELEISQITVIYF